MPRLTPVDYDPFAETMDVGSQKSAPAEHGAVGSPKLTPVDHDPFSAEKKAGQPRLTPVGYDPFAQDAQGITPPEQNQSAGADLLTDVKRGGLALPGAIAGVFDLPSALISGTTPVSDFTEKIGKEAGFTPGKWAEDARGEYSPERQEVMRNLDKAWDDGTMEDIAVQYLAHPVHNVGRLVAESIPATLAGGAIGKGAMMLGAKAGTAAGAVAGAAGKAAKVKPIPGYITRAMGKKAKYAPVVGGGIGEGVISAGMSMEGSDAENARRAAIAALAQGTGTALIGGLGGAFSIKRGLADVDTLFTGGLKSLPEGTKKGIVRRVAEGATIEGVLEELPQSVQEQAWDNWAVGRPLDENLVRAGVEGMAAGFGMGGGAALIPGSGAGLGREGGIVPPSAPTAAPTAPTATPAGLGIEVSEEDADVENITLETPRSTLPPVSTAGIEVSEGIEVGVMPPSAPPPGGIGAEDTGLPPARNMDEAYGAQLPEKLEDIDGYLANIADFHNALGPSLRSLRASGYKAKNGDPYNIGATIAEFVSEENERSAVGARGAVRVALARHYPEYFKRLRRSSPGKAGSYENPTYNGKQSVVDAIIDQIDKQRESFLAAKALPAPLPKKAEIDRAVAYKPTKPRETQVAPDQNKAAPAPTRAGVPVPAPAAEARGREPAGESIYDVRTEDLPHPMPAWLQRLSQPDRQLYKVDEAKRAAHEASGEIEIERDALDGGVAHTLESTIYGIASAKEGMERSSGRLMRGGRTGNATTQGVIDGWVRANREQNALDQWKKSNPDKWEAYQDRQVAVSKLQVGDKVRSPYPSREQPFGAIVTIKRKNKKNWSLEGEHGRKQLLPPSVLRPVETRAGVPVPAAPIQARAGEAADESVAAAATTPTAVKEAPITVGDVVSPADAEDADFIPAGRVLHRSRKGMIKVEGNESWFPEHLFRKQAADLPGGEAETEPSAKVPPVAVVGEQEETQGAPEAEGKPIQDKYGVGEQRPQVAAKKKAEKLPARSDIPPDVSEEHGTLGAKGEEAKQPWEMTSDEWKTADAKNWTAVHAAEAKLNNLKFQPKRKDPEADLRQLNAITAATKEAEVLEEKANNEYGGTAARKEAVRKAKMAGKPVPLEVLADFPDLQLPEEVADDDAERVQIAQQETKSESKKTPKTEEKAEAGAESASSVGNPKTSAKLRRIAGRMDKQIEAKLNPSIGQQNMTARRARIAGGMADEGRRLQETQAQLSALADAHERGDVPVELAGIASRADVEAVRRSGSLVPSWNAGRDGGWQGEAATQLLAATKGKRGSAEARRYLTNNSGPYSPVKVGHIKALIKIAGGSVDPSTKRAVDEIRANVREYERMERLGLLKSDVQYQSVQVTYAENIKAVQAALAELTGPKAPVDTKAQRIRALERDLVGTKPGIDYFPTPAAVVDDMIERADIQAGQRVLEPSAGKGNIADKIKAAGVEPDVVELSSALREILEAKEYSLVESDFLEYSPGAVYDRIVMNPPFGKGADMAHVRHAYDLLKPGGKVVAIMSEGPFFRNDKKATGFREWLDEQGGSSEELDSGQLADRKVTQRSEVKGRIVEIEKGAGKAEAKQETAAVSSVPPETNEESKPIYVWATYRTGASHSIITSTNKTPPRISSGEKRELLGVAKDRESYNKLSDDGFWVGRWTLSQWKEALKQETKTEKPKKTEEGAARAPDRSIAPPKVAPAHPPTQAAASESIAESAENTPLNLSEAQKWLLAEIDKRIAQAPSYKDKQFVKVTKEGIDEKKPWTSAPLQVIAGTTTINVPGDGRFTLVNIKERLQDFRAKVSKSTGFKEVHRKRTLGKHRGTITATIKEFETSNNPEDIRNAIELRRLRGEDVSKLEAKLPGIDEAWEGRARSSEGWRVPVAGDVVISPHGRGIVSETKKGFAVVGMGAKEFPASSGQGLLVRNWRVEGDVADKSKFVKPAPKPGEELSKVIDEGQEPEAKQEPATTLPVRVSESDINVARAFDGTSHSPEKREQEAKREYVSEMVDVWRKVEGQITDENRERVEEQFAALKEGYASRLNAYYAAHGRVMSTFVTGASNFPARSNQKKSDTASKRLNEALEWLRKGRVRLQKAIRGPIDHTPQGELQQAQAKLKEREDAQERMKRINAAHKKFLKSPGSLESSDLSEAAKKLVREYKSAYSWEPHPYAPYELKNNNAEIRRLKGRVNDLKGKTELAEKAQGPEEFPFDGGVVELDYTEQRLIIRHDEKPSAEVRAALKAKGFHWSRKNNAWQRKLTENAKYAAQEITGVDALVAQASYAGPKARTSNQSALADAVKMEQQGADKEAIRKETGWFLGMDDKWRFEISDEDMSLKANPKVQPGRPGASPYWRLGDFIDHPALFAAYPELRDVRVETAAKSSWYSPKTNTIGVTNVSEEKRLNALVHEISHRIAAIEGFARGGSSAEFRQSMLSKIVSPGKSLTLANKLYHERYEGKRQADFPATEGNVYRLVSLAAKESAAGNRKKALEHAESAIEIDSYRRLAGEIEARDAAGRRKLTDKQRTSLEPYVSQGVTREDAIVRFGRATADSSGELAAGTVDDLRKNLENSLGRRLVRRMERNDILNLVQSADDLPPGQASDTRGLWAEKKIWLVADNIGNVEDALAAAVTLHEGEHAAMKPMLGRSYNALQARFDRMVRSGEATAVAAVERVPGVTPAAHIESERLAYFIEEAYERIQAGKPGTVSGRARKLLADMLTAVKAWFRQTEMGKALAEAGVDWKLDDAYAVALARRALRVASRGVEGVDGGVQYHKAWHGSPHEIGEEGFSLHKIGSGEGAQAYGWGLYFADSKGVAEYYREALSGETQYILNGEVLPLNDERNYYLIPPLVTRTGGQWEAFRRQQLRLARHDLKRLAELTDVPEKVLAELKEKRGIAVGFLETLKEGDISIKEAGSLYEVELAPSQDEYLDWDKLLSEQSESVLQSIKKASWVPGELSDWSGREYYKRLGREIGAQNSITYALSDDVAFPQSTRSLSSMYEQTSKALAAAGIPGIKYLDGASRSKGEGNYNYVIFDDKQVKIDAKYSRPKARSGGQASRPRQPTAPTGFGKSIHPDVQSRLDAAKTRTKTALRDKATKAVRETWHEFTRAFPKLAKSRYGAVLDVLRQWKNVPEYSHKKAFEKIYGFVGTMGEEERFVYTMNLVLPDMLQDIDSGLLEDGPSLPFGYKNRAAVEADARNFREQAGTRQEINKAIAARSRYMNTTKRQLVEAGLLDEKVLKNDAYYHHQVLDYLALGDKYGTGTGSTDARVHKKGWQRARTGSTKDYNLEYLEAEFEVISQQIAQLEAKKHLDRIGRLENIRPKLKEQADDENWQRMSSLYPNAKRKDVLVREIKEALGRDYLTWQDALKRDYNDTHTTWKPAPGTAWYHVNTVNDKIIEQIEAEGFSEVVLEDVGKAMARGRDVEWVLPNELAETMDDPAQFPKEDTIIGRASAQAISKWKAWTLLNPFRLVKYNLNNMSGDMDISLAFDWRILTYWWEAAKDLYQQMKHPEKMSGALRKELDDGLRFGAINSGFVVHDIEDFSRAYKQLTNPTPNLAMRYWNSVTELTNFRENMLRLAAFRYFKDRLKNGDKTNGASEPVEIDDMIARGASREELAAKLGRELIGDYGNISHAGQYMRKRMIPFYSWLEINAPRYVRLMKNMPHEEGRSAGGAVGVTAWKTAKLGAKMAGFAAMVMLWNATMFPDEEDELTESQRRQLHLVLGRREDGSIRTIRIQGAFSDALSWFGAEDIPTDVKELIEGKKDLYEYMGETLGAAPSKLWQGAKPIEKTIAETIIGRTTWPDIMQPRPIRDRTEHIMRFLSVGVPYKHLSGKPSRGWANDMQSLLVYNSDPGEAAYYETRSNMYDYLDDKGVERPSASPTSKGNALYYYRQALKYGDFEAAEKYREKYFELGGTRRGMRISIKRAKPIMMLPRKYRVEFMRQMSSKERESYKRANEWYVGTYLRRM